MRKIILFSTLTKTNSDKLLDLIFTKDLDKKVLAYMPSNGEDIKEKYVTLWKEYAQKYNSVFLLINNFTNTEQEYRNLLRANILVISGGNTFVLLKNLRKSGLDAAIKEFVKKEDIILAGMSAGGLVLTPTIQICESVSEFSDNIVNLHNLTGLNIVNFEISPHFTKEKFGKELVDYKSLSKNEVKEISDDDYIVIDL
ncbi:MAG: Type 1 glutamine amidotransferase-like domain-containing protein [Candidatus Nomurabacteria bacterium]